MEATIPRTESVQEETVDIDWVESEWFQVWLELARHERREEEHQEVAEE
jgi:hypothetical protein